MTDHAHTVEIIVHTFTIGDVEDPDLTAGISLYNWEWSAEGQWVMAHAADTPTWYRREDLSTWGYRYEIRARFREQALTEYYLRWA